MIPYEELCDALARWRAKNGMSTSAARSVNVRADGRREAYAPPPPVVTAPRAAAFAPPPMSASSYEEAPAPLEEVPEDGEESFEATMVGSDIPGLGQPASDPTNEIDIDGEAVDVLDEQDA